MGLQLLGCCIRAPAKNKGKRKGSKREGNINVRVISLISGWRGGYVCA